MKALRAESWMPSSVANINLKTGLQCIIQLLSVFTSWFSSAFSLAGRTTCSTKKIFTPTGRIACCPRRPTSPNSAIRSTSFSRWISVRRFVTSHSLLSTKPRRSGTLAGVVLIETTTFCSRKNDDYTLNKSYQLYENDVTLQIITPLSAVHSVGYIMSQGISLLVRIFFGNVELVLYVAVLEWVFVVSALCVTNALA